MKEPIQPLPSASLAQDQLTQEELAQAFNGFTKWLSFRGEGVITTNNREEQQATFRLEGVNFEGTIDALYEDVRFE